MAEVRSIFDYVAKKCFDGLYDAAEKYIEKYWASMGLNSRLVPEIQNAELTDAWVRRVFVSDLPGDRIAFDVGLEVQVAVSSADRHNDSEDECYQWLRISCEGDLAKGLDDWTITRICVYNKQKFPENSMSDALVPDIKNDQMEAVAKQFLRDYYPEALKITKPGVPPVYVDPNILAERLHLNVLPHRINEEQTVFGQIYFNETEAALYNPAQEMTVPVHIPAGTIIVDPDVFLLRNLGSMNNTIIHECLHWDKHRKVFLLEKLYNKQASGISCEVVGGAQTQISRKATEEMERQANRLTPRIQMPAIPFKAKASEYIAKFMRETGAYHEVDVMEMVINQLSTDFVVSRQAVKFRLVELGYEAAAGTLTWVDGRYVPPHAYRKGAIRHNQTYTIPAQDAAIQSLVNPALTHADRYIYIEAHFVLNHPRFVTQDKCGNTMMTNYARYHLDECCLAFDISIRGNVGKDYHLECYLNRERDCPYDFNLVYTGEYKELDQESRNKLLKETILDEAKMLDSLSNNYTSAWKELLKWRGISQAELSRRTKISEKTIGNIINRETTGTINNVVLMCLAAHLPWDMSSYLIDRCGHSFIFTNNDHIWYRFVLKNMYTKSVEEVQDFLQEQGAAPL